MELDREDECNMSREEFYSISEEEEEYFYYEKKKKFYKIRYFIFKLFYKFNTITLKEAVSLLSNHFMKSNKHTFMNNLNTNISQYSLSMILDWGNGAEFIGNKELKIYCNEHTYCNEKIIKKTDPMHLNENVNIREYNMISNSISAVNNGNGICYYDLRVEKKLFNKLMKQINLKLFW